MIINVSSSSVESKAWVISDIHGCYDQLIQLILKMKLGSNDVLYALGDYVDRGPDSKKVLDFMIKRKVRALIGNHEDMMITCYTKPQYWEWWMGNGGKQTLESFGVSKPSDITIKYIRWVKKLPLYFKYKNFVLSHAGLDYNGNEDPHRMSSSNREFILWNRKVKEPKDKNIKLIVGHTPVDLARAKKSRATGKIMIDGGCARGGNLIAYCMDTNEMVSVRGYKD